MKWDLAKLAKKIKAIPYLFYDDDLKRYWKEPHYRTYSQMMSAHLNTGALYVLAGDPRGWTQIERGVRGKLLGAVAEFAKSDQWIEEKVDFGDGHVTSVQGINGALAWCGAMAFGYERGAKAWAERAIAAVNANDRRILHVSFFWWHEYPFIPFVLQLHCRVFGGSVTISGKQHPKWRDFQHVIDAWDAPANKLAEPLSKLCDYHVENCWDTGTKDTFLSYAITPIEILALKSLRAAKNLPFPEVDHPLLRDNPLADIPDKFERFRGDKAEAAALEWTRKAFPKFISPFGESKPAEFIGLRKLIADLPSDSKAAKKQSAVKDVKREAKGQSSKAADTPIQQFVCKPIVKGRVPRNARYPDKLCRAVWKELGYSVTACRKALNGAEEIDAETMGNQIAYSKFGIIVDWRGSLVEMLDLLEPIAKALRVKMEYDADGDDAAEVTFKIGKKSQTAAVRYEPDGDTSLHDVVGTLQAASNNSLLFFPLRDSLVSDTYCYVVLSPEKAKSLRSICKKRFDKLFASF